MTLIIIFLWILLHLIVTYVKGITAREAEEDQEFILETGVNGAALLQNWSTRQDSSLLLLSNLAFVLAGVMALFPGAFGRVGVYLLLIGAGFSAVAAVRYRLNRRRILSLYLKEVDTMSVPEPRTADRRRVYKPWWESKTIWFQILTAVVAGLSLAVDLQATLGFPDNYRAYILIAVAVINVFLRGITTQPMTRTRP